LDIFEALPIVLKPAFGRYPNPTKVPARNKRVNAGARADYGQLDHGQSMPATPQDPARREPADCPQMGIFLLPTGSITRQNVAFSAYIQGVPLNLMMIAQNPASVS
jgi:hypothetical protein